MTHAFLAFALASLGATPPTAVAPPAVKVSTAQVRGAVERSIGFLQSDAVGWREKSKCSTCHHGAMTVAVLSEARNRGIAVEEKSLADMLAWTKERFVPAYEEKPNLTGGFQIPSLAMPILTLSLATNPSAVTRDEIDRMTKYILDRQEAAGGWPLPERPAHPFFESRETMTLWFLLALEPGASGDGKYASAARAAREKAREWLSKTPPADTTQVAALRLLVDLHDHMPRTALRSQIGPLLKRQNTDGGWSQTPELKSDGYATGQALYVLSLAGVKPGSKEVQRGAAFLVTTQREDASWSMISRETSDRKPATNLSPIVYFGSAWATLGLIRSLPKGDIR